MTKLKDLMGIDKSEGYLSQEEKQYMGKFEELLTKLQHLVWIDDAEELITRLKNLVKNAVIVENTPTGATNIMGSLTKLMATLFSFPKIFGFLLWRSPHKPEELMAELDSPEEHKSRGTNYYKNKFEELTTKLKDLATMDAPEDNMSWFAKFCKIKLIELMTKLKDHVSADEPILKLCAYKVPLNMPLNVSQRVFFHMFIVFETETWWWSLEKHTDGITIQRSRKLAAVKERYRQSSRPQEIILMEEDKGQCSVYSLIEWLHRGNELKKSYHLLERNCKHFAKAVFDHAAKSKTINV